MHILTAYANSHATSCIKRTLSNEMNNDRADGHCYSFAWNNDLGCSVNPIFLLMDHFLYQFSTSSKKMKKTG